MAKAQRVLIFLVVGMLLVNLGGVALLLSVRSGVIGAGTFGGAWPFMAFASLNLLLIVCAILQTVRLSAASGTHWTLAVSAGALLLIPWLGLLVLMFINIYATRLLVNNAVAVGFFGVTGAEMKKLVIGACASCGYDIRGLPTLQCPECGTPFPPCPMVVPTGSDRFTPINP